VTRDLSAPPYEIRGEELTLLLDLAAGRRTRDKIVPDLVALEWPQEFAEELAELVDTWAEAPAVAGLEADPIAAEELPEAMPREERARVLHGRGYSYRKVGVALGVSRTTVRRWLGVLGRGSRP
jgi:DNA-directed RNA polymerase specialized sigma24 family protein